MKKLISLMLSLVMLLSITANAAVVSNYEFVKSAGRGWELVEEDNIVYFADGNGGVRIIDANDINNLIELGQIKTGFDTRIVEKNKEVLYVGGGNQLITYNIKDPANTFIVKTDSIHTNAARMNMDGNLLGVFGGASAQIFDVSKRSQPVKVATITGMGTGQCGYLKDG